MTPDQQLFEKVKRDDECCHEWGYWKGTRHSCAKCDKTFTDRPTNISGYGTRNPDFTTPEGFFWLWERLQEKGWQDIFRAFLWKEFHTANDDLSVFRSGIPVEFINPLKFRAALMEYWGIKEEL